MGRGLQNVSVLQGEFCVVLVLILYNLKKKINSLYNETLMCIFWEGSI